jgi:hypothetical protein
MELHYGQALKHVLVNPNCRKFLAALIVLGAIDCCD